MTALATMQDIRIDAIRVNPHQPRKEFSDEDLEELAESIRAVGLIHPPVVRPTEEPEVFELIAGERRMRACQLLGLQRICVMVRETTEVSSAEAALIENVQRVDLNPLEVAAALEKLMEEFHYSQEDLAKRVGKKRSTVANYLRLLALPVEIRNGLRQNLITMGHAKVILSLDHKDKQVLLYEKIVRDNLTVRQTEDAAVVIRDKAKRRRLVYKTRDFYLEQLGEKVQRHLGTKVAITGTAKKGRLHIDYYSLDDLDRLLEILGVKGD